MGMALDEPKDKEVPVKANGIDVLISDKDKGYAEGNVIDYIIAPDGEGFTISKGTPGCGSGCGDKGCGQAA